MIDALARPTATLRSKLLRHIPAPQTTSGFAEVRHKTIAYRAVKCECRSLWQEHSAERECAKAERRAVAKGDREAIRKYPRESELFLH